MNQRIKNYIEKSKENSAKFKKVLKENPTYEKIYNTASIVLLTMGIGLLICSFLLSTTEIENASKLIIYVMVGLGLVLITLKIYITIKVYKIIGDRKPKGEFFNCKHCGNDVFECICELKVDL